MIRSSHFGDSKQIKYFKDDVAETHSVVLCPLVSTKPWSHHLLGCKSKTPSKLVALQEHFLVDIGYLDTKYNFKAPLNVP
jgi:hypothetical protein